MVMTYLRNSKKQQYIIINNDYVEYEYTDDNLLISKNIKNDIYESEETYEYDELQRAWADGKALTVKLNEDKKVKQDKKFLELFTSGIKDIEPNKNRYFIKESTITIKDKKNMIYQCVLFSDGFYVLLSDKKEKNPNATGHYNFCKAVPNENGFSP